MRERQAFEFGDWFVICEVCNFRILASKARKRWDGLVVCPKDWETRHPQDFTQPQRPERPLPFTRPPIEKFGTQTFTDSVISCTESGKLSQAGYGRAGCFEVGNVNGNLV